MSRTIVGYGHGVWNHNEVPAADDEFVDFSTEAPGIEKIIGPVLLNGDAKLDGTSQTLNTHPWPFFLANQLLDGIGRHGGGNDLAIGPSHYLAYPRFYPRMLEGTVSVDPNTGLVAGVGTRFLSRIDPYDNQYPEMRAEDNDKFVIEDPELNIYHVCRCQEVYSDELLLLKQDAGEDGVAYPWTGGALSGVKISTNTTTLAPLGGFRGLVSIDPAVNPKLIVGSNTRLRRDITYDSKTKLAQVHVEDGAGGYHLVTVIQGEEDYVFMQDDWPGEAVSNVRVFAYNANRPTVPVTNTGIGWTQFDTETVVFDRRYYDNGEGCYIFAYGFPPGEERDFWLNRADEIADCHWQSTRFSNEGLGVLTDTPTWRAGPAHSIALHMTIIRALRLSAAGDPRAAARWTWIFDNGAYQYHAWCGKLANTTNRNAMNIRYAGFGLMYMATIAMVTPDGTYSLNDARWGFTTATGAQIRQRALDLAVAGAGRDDGNGNYTDALCKMQDETGNWPRTFGAEDAEGNSNQPFIMGFTLAGMGQTWHACQGKGLPYTRYADNIKTCFLRTVDYLGSKFAGFSQMPTSTGAPSGKTHGWMHYWTPGHGQWHWPAEGKAILDHGFPNVVGVDALLKTQYVDGDSISFAQPQPGVTAVIKSTNVVLIDEPHTLELGDIVLFRQQYPDWYDQRVVVGVPNENSVELDLPMPATYSGGEYELVIDNRIAQYIVATKGVAAVTGVGFSNCTPGVTYWAFVNGKWRSFAFNTIADDNNATVIGSWAHATTAAAPVSPEEGGSYIVDSRPSENSITLRSNITHPRGTATVTDIRIVQKVNTKIFYDEDSSFGYTWGSRQNNPTTLYAFGQAYHWTRDEKYRDIGDRIFGATFGYTRVFSNPLDAGPYTDEDAALIFDSASQKGYKQHNQAYSRWAHKYLSYRRLVLRGD